MFAKLALAVPVVVAGAILTAPAASAQEHLPPPTRHTAPHHAVRHATARPASHTAVRVSGARARLLAAARSYLGVRYRHGGASRAGVDCSGLVGAVYRQGIGARLPRTVAQLARAGRRTWRPAVGDVLMYGRYHVAIVAAVSGNRVIDTIVARHSGTRVQHQAPYEAYTVRMYLT